MKNNEPDKYNEITNRLLKEYKAEIIPHSITEKIFSEKIILYDASGTAISRENPLWVPIEIEYKTTITEIIEKAVKEMPFDRKPSNEDIAKAY